MKLIIATQNPGKAIEVKEILNDTGFEILSAKDIGITDDVIEDGKTFEENALKKARFVSKKSKCWAIGDDSGICIDFLDGEPGINSARWAGIGANNERIVKHTLKELNGLPLNKRKASFICTLALVSPQNKHWFFKGQVSGHITLKPVGTNRPKLPYDVIFVPNGYSKTYAQITDKQKNAIGHRGQAFKKFKSFIKVAKI